MIAERVVGGMGRITFEEREGYRAYHWAGINPDSESDEVEYEKRVRLPSCTTLLGRIVSSEGLVRWAAQQGGQAETVRMQSAERGTVVHNVLETYATTGEEPRLSDHKPEHRGYVQGLTRWILSDDPEPIHIERLTCHPGLGYAGRYDLLCKIGGLTVMVDLKSNARGMIQDKSVAQLALYAEAEVSLGSDYPDDVAVLSVTDRGDFELISCGVTDEMVREIAESAARWHNVSGLCRRIAGRRSRQVRKEEESNGND